MAKPKLTKLELQILEALWAQGKASIREIQEAFPEPRPAYTTIQTTVYRLEGGFELPANSVCFQLLAFQAVTASLLNPVERFGTWRLPAATFLSTREILTSRLA